MSKEWSVCIISYTCARTAVISTCIFLAVRSGNPDPRPLVGRVGTSAPSSYSTLPHVDVQYNISAISRLKY